MSSLDGKMNTGKTGRVRKRLVPYTRPKTWRGYAARFYTDEAVAERETKVEAFIQREIDNKVDRKAEFKMASDALDSWPYTPAPLPPPPSPPCPTPPPSPIITAPKTWNDVKKIFDDLTLDINTACIGCGQIQLDAQCDCMSFVDRLD